MKGYIGKYTGMDIWSIGPNKAESSRQEYECNLSQNTDSVRGQFWHLSESRRSAVVMEEGRSGST